MNTRSAYQSGTPAASEDDRLDGGARESVERLREAAASRDAEKMREHMGEVREQHGWLYRELAEHPAIATLLDELALWGF